MARARVFIDFWNFQLGWNANVRARELCDWRSLPRVLVAESTALLHTAGVSDALQLEETIVHASVDPISEQPLAKWLKDFLDRQPSFDVKVRERRSRPKSIHCKSCQTTTSACPQCGAGYTGKPEKGVDAALVTDLLALAWQGAYDVAVLVSSDGDFVPAVEHVQAKGLKVVNAGWRSTGHELKQACWASFDLDQLVGRMMRT